MKKVNADDYYINYLKNKTLQPQQIEQKKDNDSPKEKIQEALKKSFENSEQKFYSLV